MQVEPIRKGKSVKEVNVDSFMNFHIFSSLKDISFSYFVNCNNACFQLNSRYADHFTTVSHTFAVSSIRSFMIRGLDAGVAVLPTICSSLQSKL